MSSGIECDVYNVTCSMLADETYKSAG